MRSGWGFAAALRRMHSSSSCAGKCALPERYDKMRDAVIVSTARTPIGKAYRGALNNVPSPTLAAHAIREAVKRASVDPEEIDDCIVGSAFQQGYQGMIGRTSAL